MDKVNFLFYDIAHAAPKITWTWFTVSKDVLFSFKACAVCTDSHQISIRRLWVIHRKKYEILWILEDCARHGNTSLCWFLFARGLLHPSNIKKLEDKFYGQHHVLIVATKNGHVSILQFLKDIGFTTKDARGGSNDALHEAARHGHCHVLQFLKNEWGLTSSDARSNAKWTLNCVAERGHLDVLKFLKNEFGLTADHVRRSDALLWAAWFGHMEMCQFIKQWLSEDIGVKLDGLEMLTRSGQARLQKQERILEDRDRVKKAMEKINPNQHFVVWQFLKSWLDEF